MEDKNLFGVKVAGLNSEYEGYKNNPERYSEACKKINAGLLDTLGIEIAEKEELSNMVDAGKLYGYLKKIFNSDCFQYIDEGWYYTDSNRDYYRIDPKSNRIYPNWSKISDPNLKEKFYYLDNYMAWYKDHNNSDLVRDWIYLKYILPKSEAKKLIGYAIELAAHTWTSWNYGWKLKFREPLRGEINKEDIPGYLAWWTDRKEQLLEKIANRTLNKERRDKMQDEIDKHGSVLPETNYRYRNYWSWYGDVILSLTTGKIYDLWLNDKWGWEAELEKDYKSRRNYESISGASASGTIISGKKTIVYLPTSRIRVFDKSDINWENINGLNMTVVMGYNGLNRSHPTIIKDVAWVDFVFLSQKDKMKEWAAKTLIDAIQTKWESLKKLPTRYFKTKYFDENLQEKELLISYKSDMEDEEINFKFLGTHLLGIKRWFDVEETWGFIDRKAWIRKHNDKYVRLGTFWLIKEILDQHPVQLNREIEVRWDTIEEKDSEYKKVNWWTILDWFAYKSWKDKWSSLGFQNILREHKNQNLTKEDFKDFETEIKGLSFELVPSYYLIIEENPKNLYNKELLSKLNINMDELDSVMEYEYKVPKVLFDKFPLSYRQDFMHKKLVKKAMESLNIYRMPLEQQKNIVKDYLKIHKNDVFTLQDSYDVWNCRPWTDRFVKAYHLVKENTEEVQISWEELLNHKHFEKMLSESNFRKIFINKFAQEISDLEPMDNDNLEAPVVNLEDDSKEETPPKTRKTRVRKIARKED